MKVKYYLPVAALLFLFSCGSNSSQTDTAQAANDSNQAKMDSSKTNKDTTALSASISDHDTKFAVDAANIGMMEIALGNVAQQNAMGKDVKDFGAMMVKDHTSAGDELKKISDAKHITLPTALSADDQKKVDDMKAMTGKKFDKTYIDMMINGHKKAADEFQDEINQGSDADLRSFATKTLDVIHAHLDSAQKCKSMEKGM
jgi:putative membrane protein